MKKFLVLILGCFMLLSLTGCGKVKLLGVYSSGEEYESMYFYYKFSKEGNKSGTCEYYEYMEEYGESSVTYNYELEKVTDEVYYIYFENAENGAFMEATYNTTTDTIVDSINTYEKIEE